MLKYRAFGLGETSGYRPPSYGPETAVFKRRLLSYHGAGRSSWFEDQSIGSTVQKITTFWGPNFLNAANYRDA